MLPPVTWFETDVIIIATLIAIIPMLVSLAKQSDFSPWAKFYLNKKGNKLVINGKVLPEDVSQKIIKFSKKVRLVVRVLTITYSILIAYMFCFYHVFITNAVYLVTFNSLFTLLVFLPMYIFYMVYSKYTPLLFLKSILILGFSFSDSWCDHIHHHVQQLHSNSSELCSA